MGWRARFVRPSIIGQPQWECWPLYAVSMEPGGHIRAKYHSVRQRFGQGNKSAEGKVSFPAQRAGPDEGERVAKMWVGLSREESFDNREARRVRRGDLDLGERLRAPIGEHWRARRRMKVAMRYATLRANRRIFVFFPR